MDKYILATGLFLCCFSQAVAVDYHVATNGTPAATGAIGDPFSRVQLAADVAGPGDTVYIHGGKYHEAVTISGLVGVSTNRIVFRNYNDEEVLLSGTIPVTNNWSRWSQNSNVWKTAVTQDVWQLFVDGKSMTGARWPEGRSQWTQSYWHRWSPVGTGLGSLYRTGR